MSGRMRKSRSDRTIGRLFINPFDEMREYYAVVKKKEYTIDAAIGMVHEFLLLLILMEYLSRQFDRILRECTNGRM